MGVGNVHFRQTKIQRPWMTLGLSTVHHNDQGPFSAKKVDEKLKEGVDGECLDDGLPAAPVTTSPRGLIYLIDIS